jgi:hypothetical protein
MTKDDVVSALGLILGASAATSAGGTAVSAVHLPLIIVSAVVAVSCAAAIALLLRNPGRE